MRTDAVPKLSRFSSSPRACEPWPDSPTLAEATARVRRVGMVVSVILHTAWPWELGADQHGVRKRGECSFVG